VTSSVCLLLPFKELLMKLPISKVPSLHFILIGIGTLQSSNSSFDTLLEYEKKKKTYSQKENLCSIDCTNSNLFYEDAGILMIFLPFIIDFY